MRLISILFFVNFFILNFTHALELKGNSNQAAWEVKKTFFLLSSQKPVGINNSIAVKKILQGDSHILEVTIPLDKFDSKEPERDLEVRKILKEDLSPALVFQSQALSESELQGLKFGKLKLLKGKLKIGKEFFETQFKMRLKENFLMGTYEGKLSDFNVKPPKVAGGVVANVKDYVKLYVKIGVSDI